MMYLERKATAYLRDWHSRETRKPLVIRGARQVGKTRLVERFGQDSFASAVTVDLEQHDELHSLFDRGDPEGIVEELSLYFGEPIIPGTTLLFLDEIQACPKALAALRYFYEQIPELHVVAAGSILDFALREFEYSMPVGRIEFMYLHPLTFEEFLTALGHGQLVEFLNSLGLRAEISPALHGKLLDLQRRYFFIGGMPEPVAVYAGSPDLLDVQRAQHSILNALEGDFAKYGTRAQQRHMRSVMRFVPRNIGRKVKYARINGEARSGDLKTALELLELSRLVRRVRQTAANGVPLAAEAVDSHFKTLFLDIGLCSQACGLRLVAIEELLTVMEGMLAEQFIGQELLAQGHPFEERELFYWHREQRNANAEVDFLHCDGDQIVPIEVKAGTSGSLKSLHLFLQGKNRRFGVRFNTSPPSMGQFPAEVRTGSGAHSFSYELLSLPLYLCGQLDRLLADWL